MLLDNSIVVLENIYRLVQKNMPVEQAVIEGSKEVWRSIFAATLTTAIVFLPFIFASNFIIRTLGYHIGVSIVSTLFVSLLVALMLIPMVANYFFRMHDVKSLQFQKVSASSRSVQIYTLLLKSAMRFPLRTIVWTVVIFFSSVLLALALSLSSQQQTETQDFNLYITMPEGSTLQTTDLAAIDLESRLENIDEIEEIISQVYEEEAILTLKLKEDFESLNSLTIPEVKGSIDERLDDFRAADVSFEQPQTSTRFQGGNRGEMTASFERMLGVGSQTEKILIKGRDFEVMRRVADDIQYQLDALSAVDRVRMNVSRNRPEIHLLFDQEILNNYDVSLMGITSELSNFEKEISVGANFKQKNEHYDILIQNSDLEKITIEDLRELPILSESGSYYPLEQISRIIYSEGSAGINRINQEKQIDLSYSFITEISESKTFLEDARREVESLLNSLEIPSGIALEMEKSEADLSEFYFLIGLAALLIYMILAAVFESLLNPVVIMFTIPLAAIGSLWAIIITGNSLLNTNTLIGFLILLGIVVNNGIILIDFTRILRQRSFRRSRALIIAGRARLRPILITAITTIVAMVPLAMGKVDYVTSIAAPFAITVIGGLSLSTLFTLIFIPTVYSGLESMLSWFRQLDWRLKITQSVLFFTGAVLIVVEIESIIWQFANLFILMLIIPGLTYFVMNSLRSARSTLIKPGQPVKISIKNLYKIYDQPGRFSREWSRGKKISARDTSKPLPGSWIYFLQMSWHLFLFIFLIYYIYFYLQQSFWIFFLSHFLYFYGLFLLPQFSGLSVQIRKKQRNPIAKIHLFFLWFFPLLNLIIFYFKWKTVLSVIFIGVAWYFMLMVYKTSHRLTKQLIDINRIRGRFSNLKKRYYRLIRMVPFIGKKTTPFYALSGISLDIESGMFGLLGPNGAGKTTLMRVICGILKQSYGSVHFNQIDAGEKREELQGLIGYLPQDFGTYENMTAFEFLSYQAIMKNILPVEEREKRVLYVLASVHLETHRDEKIGSFSGGMKQRIGIAQTLLHLPRVLVVDEPTAGLDPRERIRFRNLLVELSRERVVIFSTHIIEDIASSCDKVAVLDRGLLKYLGTPTEMLELADGFVWQCLVGINEFEKIRASQNIIHHIKVANRIRIRLLSRNRPLAGAIPVKPTLEDSYLWLLSIKV
jgi:ABC-type multidrug transport system ATPase subunit